MEISNFHHLWEEKKMILLDAGFQISNMTTFWTEEKPFEDS